MNANSTLYPYFLKHPHICTDSRKVEKGDFFFALSGPRFDGNAFALQALRDGAACAVVSDEELVRKDNRCLYVPDTLVALQELAHTHRMHFDIPVIAITGTNGKTTTKELTRSVLAQKYAVLSTEGNLNNHIGVPLTLLRLTEEHEIALVEMGASGAGEIELLASIAHPTAGLITNVGKAHLEGFGSIEGVLEAKSELPEFLKAHGGTYFLNADDPRLFAKWASFAAITYGLDKDKHPDLSGVILRDHPFLELCVFTAEEPIEILTHLTGKYNYQNVLAATAVGLHFGIRPEQIKTAVEGYHPSNSRSQVIEWSDGITVIMDAYNANPSSMMAALKNLAELSLPRKIAILGDMLELGTASEAEHTAVVEWLKSEPEITPYLCGKEFRKAGEGTFPVYETSDDLVSHLSDIRIPAGSCILIKGSRGIALEKVLSALRELYQ